MIQTMERFTFVYASCNTILQLKTCRSDALVVLKTSFRRSAQGRPSANAVSMLQEYMNSMEIAITRRMHTGRNPRYASMLGGSLGNCGKSQSRKKMTEEDKMLKSINTPVGTMH